MLSTLAPGAIPVPLIGRGRGGAIAYPRRGAKWMRNRPPVRAAVKHRVRLADGVWIISRQLQVSAAAAAELISAEEVIETGRRLDPPEWMTRGLCAQLTPDYSDALFFGVEHREAPGALIAAANTARQICLRCPVAAICLTNALVEDERYGVWGGTSGRQRAKLRIRMARGAVVEDLVAECLGHHDPLPDLGPRVLAGAS